MALCWSLKDPVPRKIERLRLVLECEAATAAVLVNRGVDSREKARRFLRFSLKDMHPPFSIRDMDVAVNRICRALQRNEKILIFGDYDVDGITSTAIMLDFLRRAGGRVSHYIPHRIREGYGLKTDHVARCIAPEGIGLLITVDCGSGSHQAVQAANAAGVDVIITDHHSVGADLPPALAVINPKRSDGPAGFENLAGVGVAFSLLICLRTYLRKINFWNKRPAPNLKHYCDLVALGTVADMVPLVGDNRILARTGIEMMSNAPRPGIQSLMEMAGMREKYVDAEDIAFRLAPRLNAAGRIKHADRAVELLAAPDLQTARRMAEPLERLNTQRQILEKIILQQIEQRLTDSPAQLAKKTIVLSDGSWHLGVLGIVASRLMKRYHRPVILITTQSGTGKGSARSIPGTDLHRLLEKTSRFLTAFGGHSLAAGLEIDPANIDLFSQDFEAAVCHTAEDSALAPVREIDWQLSLPAVSDRLLDELEQLKPFGTGNPEPVFMASHVRVVRSRRVGKNHRKMTLQTASSDGGRSIEAIWFNVDPGVPRLDHIDRLVFRLRWNRWNGRKKAQLVIEDVETCEQVKDSP